MCQINGVSLFKECVRNEGNEERKDYSTKQFMQWKKIKLLFIDTNKHVFLHHNMHPIMNFG